MDEQLHWQLLKLENGRFISELFLFGSEQLVRNYAEELNERNPRYVLYPLKFRYITAEYINGYTHAFDHLASIKEKIDTLQSEYDALLDKYQHLL